MSGSAAGGSSIWAWAGMYHVAGWWATSLFTGISSVCRGQKSLQLPHNRLDLPGQSLHGGQFAQRSPVGFAAPDTDDPALGQKARRLWMFGDQLFHLDVGG